MLKQKKIIIALWSFPSLPITEGHLQWILDVSVIFIAPGNFVSQMNFSAVWLVMEEEDDKPFMCTAPACGQVHTVTEY